jgi:hypothetical protein
MRPLPAPTLIKAREGRDLQRQQPDPNNHPLSNNDVHAVLPSWQSKQGNTMPAWLLLPEVELEPGWPCIG